MLHQYPQAGGGRLHGDPRARKSFHGNLDVLATFPQSPLVSPRNETRLASITNSQRVHLSPSVRCLCGVSSGGLRWIFLSKYMKIVKSNMPTKSAAQAKRDRLADFGPHWRTKITISNSVIFLASRDEPVVTTDEEGNATGIKMKIIEGTEFGSSIKFIVWSDVRAVCCDFVDPTLQSEDCG